MFNNWLTSVVTSKRKGALIEEGQELSLAEFFLPVAKSHKFASGYIYIKKKNKPGLGGHNVTMRYILTYPCLYT
jgi:hypothetical protein